MVKKSGFGQMSHANRGLLFMPNRDLLAFLGFPESAYRLRSGVYAKLRSVPDICRLLVFDGFLVSNALGMTRVGYEMLYSDLGGHFGVLCNCDA